MSGLPKVSPLGNLGLSDLTNPYTQNLQPYQQAQSLQMQMQLMQMDAGTQLALSQMNAIANAIPPKRTGPDPYFIRRAESYAEKGEKLIERMAFWSAFGLFAAPIMRRLAAKLERVTDEVDGFVKQAA